MPKFWSTCAIGAFKKSAVSELNFEFDSPKESDFPLIKRIFYKAFLKAYQGHSATEMGLPFGVTKKAFLDNLFEAEMQAIRAGKIHCVVAKINEKPIAAATYKLNSATGNLYLSVFGVLPTIQSKGMGQQIIALLEKRFNSLNGIDLYTRRFNATASNFYKKNHFKEVSPQSLHIDVDETKFTGFEYLFKRSRRLPLQRSHSVPDLRSVAIQNPGI